MSRSFTAFALSLAVLLAACDSTGPRPLDQTLAPGRGGTDGGTATISGIVSAVDPGTDTTKTSPAAGVVITAFRLGDVVAPPPIDSGSVGGGNDEGGGGPPPAELPDTLLTSGSQSLASIWSDPDLGEPAATATTNDRGEFRLEQLVEGRYLLRATPPEGSAFRQAEVGDLMLLGSSSLPVYITLFRR